MLPRYTALDDVYLNMLAFLDHESLLRATATQAQQRTRRCRLISSSSRDSPEDRGEEAKISPLAVCPAGDGDPSYSALAEWHQSLYPQRNVAVLGKAPLQGQLIRHCERYGECSRAGPLSQQPPLSSSSLDTSSWLGAGISGGFS